MLDGNVLWNSRVSNGALESPERSLQRAMHSSIPENVASGRKSQVLQSLLPVTQVLFFPLPETVGGLRQAAFSCMSRRCGPGWVAPQSTGGWAGLVAGSRGSNHGSTRAGLVAGSRGGDHGSTHMSGPQQGKLQGWALLGLQGGVRVLDFLRGCSGCSQRGWSWRVEASGSVRPGAALPVGVFAEPAFKGPRSRHHLSVREKHQRTCSSFYKSDSL